MTFNRERFKADLLEDEGLRLKPYDDKTGRDAHLVSGGKITIGIGRNLSDVGISNLEAWKMLDEDIDRALAAAHEIFGKDVFEGWTESQQLGIANMIFNMGKGNDQRGFLSFRNTIRLIKKGEWAEAVTNIKASKWAKDVQKSRREKVLKYLSA